MAESLRLIATAGALLALAGAAPAAGALSISVLSKGGDPLPGGGTAALYYFPTAVNAGGEAVFSTGLADDEGRWTGDVTLVLGREGLVELARPGGSAPGGGTFAFSGVETMDISDGGQVSFTNALEPFRTEPWGLNAGVFRYATGAISAVALPGDEFAGAAGTAINDRGELAFVGIIGTQAGPDPGSGLGSGLFVADRHGEVSPVALPGDPAPGGGTFTSAQFPRSNDRGDLVFMAHEVGQDCGGTDGASCLHGGVYVRRAVTGRLETVAAPGDAAPGGNVLRTAVGPRINDLGEIAYVGYWGPGAPIPAHSGLFLSRRGLTVPLVLPGDALPGGGRVIRVRGAPPFTGINDAGQIGFAAEVRLEDGSAERRFYRWSSGGVELLAAPGTHVPGAGPIASVLFGGQIDARGRVLFSAYDADLEPLLLRAASTPRG